MRGGEGFRKILPGDEDEALVVEEFLEFGAAHEIEVVLAPLCAPIGMIEGGTLNLGVVVGEVDDELIGAWGKKLQHFLVGIEPLGLGNAGADLDNGVENDGVRIEIYVVKSETVSEQCREFVGAGSGEIDLEKILRTDDGPHVGVEVRDADAGGSGFVDLGVNFGFDVGHFCVSDDVFGEERKIAIGIEEAGTFGLRGNGRPAVAGPIGVESEMDAEVGIRMGLGPLGDLGKPGAGDENTSGSDPVIFKGFLDGGVDSVHHAEIIGVNDEETRIGGVAEALGESA